MTVRDLSARMTELGRPLLPSGVTKIEQGQRRVDADELVALAIALRVNPSRLLLPPSASEQETALTPALSVPEFLAWQWADAFAPLPTLSSEEGYNTEADHEDFLMHARPPEFRREQRRPLMQATNRLVSTVRRVVHHTAEKSDPKLLMSSLTQARRWLHDVAGVLDAIEEEAAARGER